MLTIYHFKDPYRFRWPGGTPEGVGEVMLGVQGSFPVIRGVVPPSRALVAVQVPEQRPGSSSGESADSGDSREAAVALVLRALGGEEMERHAGGQ
jgi:hypothetical protein